MYATIGDMTSVPLHKMLLLGRGHKSLPGVGPQFGVVFGAEHSIIR